MAAFRWVWECPPDTVPAGGLVGKAFPLLADDGTPIGHGKIVGADRHTISFELDIPRRLLQPPSGAPEVSFSMGVNKRGWLRPRPPD